MNAQRPSPAIPDASLENMRRHAAQELAVWQRSFEEDKKQLEASQRMITHWEDELAQLEIEQQRREFEPIVKQFRDAWDASSGDSFSSRMARKSLNASAQNDPALKFALASFKLGERELGAESESE